MDWGITDWILPVWILILVGMFAYLLSRFMTVLDAIRTAVEAILFILNQTPPSR